MSMSRGIPEPDEILNRELSWLAFNERVQEEAEDEDNPLLERLKFIAIVSSNWDEFFMVRVAGIWRQIDAGITQRGPDGYTPRALLTAVSGCIHAQVLHQHRVYHEVIAPALREEGVSERHIERVHCPIGLAIGAETPDEIAVSIVAEMIRHRSRKTL